MIRFVNCIMLLLIITILLLVAYSILIIYFWQSWVRIPIYKNSIPGNDHLEKVSVIIPARNEEKNIPVLLNSLQQQNYSHELTEIIVIDDHSEDSTAAIAKGFRDVTVITIKNEPINSYKKKAIETGIRSAHGELIITTDADCVTLPGWLKTIVSFKEANDSVFIAAPVAFTNDHGSNKLLYYFQVLDFLVLQGITGASISRKALSMCNGANLAYEKNVFYEVNGFSGIDHIASGDDMLLMHKISVRYPGKVHYIKSKEAIVYTQAAKTWKEFINQRIRWASKANKYDDKRISWVLLFVYIFNLLFLCLFIAGFINYHYWIYLLSGWVVKTIIEFPFVYSVASFFNRQSLMKYFFFFQPLHIFYTIVAGWLGQFSNYEWKGRKVK